MSSPKMFRASKGTAVYTGTAKELAKKLKASQDTVRNKARDGGLTRSGYKIIEIRDEILRTSVWTTEKEPYYNLGAAYCAICIKDYLRNPTQANANVLYDRMFQICSLGAIDPETIIKKKQKKSLKGRRMTRLEQHEFDPRKLDYLVKKSGKTLLEIARKAGVSRSALQQYLDGVINPSRESLEKICIAFAVEKEFFEGEHYE